MMVSESVVGYDFIQRLPGSRGWFSSGHPKLRSAMIFQSFGTCSNSLTSASSKSPTQHEPIPRPQAAITMFCIAMVVSTVDHLRAYALPSYAQPTIANAESLMNPLHCLWDSFSLTSGSVSTMKRHGCPLLAEGAYLPASRIFCIVSCGICSVLYFRILLRDNSRSITDIAFKESYLTQTTSSCDRCSFEWLLSIGATPPHPQTQVESWG